MWAASTVVMARLGRWMRGSPTGTFILKIISEIISWVFPVLWTQDVVSYLTHCGALVLWLTTNRGLAWLRISSLTEIPETKSKSWLALLLSLLWTYHQGIAWVRVLASSSHPPAHVFLYPERVYPEELCCSASRNFVVKNTHASPRWSKVVSWVV